MQVIAILASLVASGMLIVATALVRRGSRRRAVRPAVPGGSRRDFFGDAAAAQAPTPTLTLAPEAPVVEGPLSRAPGAPLRRAA